MAFEKQPHFVLIPFMAQGHLIPMVDIARLLAQRGVIVTIFTTPVNYKRIESVIARAIASGLQIRVIRVDFPALKAGLPEGCECLDMLPSADLGINFFTATRFLHPLIEQSLPKLSPAPSCILSDIFHPWTNQTSRKFNIPLLIFHASCTFSLVCIHNLSGYKELDDIASDSEYFVVPDLPHRIEVTKAQVAAHIKSVHSELNQLQQDMREAENSALGIVVNGFQDLESEYIAQCMKEEGKKLWCIGPVSLINKDSTDIVERGNKSASSVIDLEWLDSLEQNSVLYACLGSVSRLSTSQLIELGLGLEDSNRPFIWVVKNATEEFERWLLEENFEDRIKHKGRLIFGWAPQVLILSHPSVGLFLTHCGWNSTLESICSGVPMITWPMFAEQFLIEKFIVDVLKIGVEVGIKDPVLFGYGGETAEARVSREDIKRAIDRVINQGEEGKMRRTRAQELGNMATKAFQEDGSSYSNITHLIQDVMAQDCII